MKAEIQNPKLLGQKDGRKMMDCRMNAAFRATREGRIQGVVQAPTERRIYAAANGFRSSFVFRRSAFFRPSDFGPRI